MKASYGKRTTTKTTTAAAHANTLSKIPSGKTLEDNRSSIIQPKKNTTGLPDNLKSGIENLSGHSLDDVKVHYNSSKPAQLNAHAYAKGSNIHIASGQEKHLPHEAWHIVQQKQGRVRPTKTVAGAKINDSSSLEREADVMGEKALQRKEKNPSLIKAASLSTTAQLVKETPAQKLQKLQRRGLVTNISRIRRASKTNPKSMLNYTRSTHGGRHYYSRKDAAGRVTKFAGGLVYTRTARKSTPKVPYKRKNDQAGHLIAHSFGGPPKFTDNFVAMNKTINSKGGAWGRMESYIRMRLQQSGIKVWMSVKPHYPGIKKRPDRIAVSLTFNRSPFKVKFNIPTP